MQHGDWFANEVPQVQKQNNNNNTRMEINPPIVALSPKSALGRSAIVAHVWLLGSARQPNTKELDANNYRLLGDQYCTKTS